MSPSHRPPHIFTPDSLVFISASTIDHTLIFNSNNELNVLLAAFNEAIEKFAFEKHGWVFLPNHYHILIKSAKSSSVPEFINHLHGKSSFLVNGLNNVKGRKIWYQYWDSIIESEKEFYKHLNYIHHNPTKHRITKYMEKYQWSSYKYWETGIGRDGINECFEKYPIIDFTLVGDQE